MAFSYELALILLFSILGGVLAVRFRQPSVLGLILVGAIVGPYNLGLIKDISLIEASIEIGAILLLFTVGIEFSLSHFLNIGLRSALIAVIKLGLTFMFSYYTSILLGFSFVTALYIGVILSITSTVIVIKILDQKGMSKREELPLLIAILILEDVFGVFALTFFSGLNTQAELNPFNLFTKLLVSLTILIVTYFLLQRILKKIINWLVAYSTEETTTFVSLGLCGGLSYIALLLNLSPSVGAFLAGNIVSSLPNAKSFEKSIHPFTLTFTSLFFFSIGTIVSFNAVLASLSIVVVLFAVNIIAKFITIGFGSYLFTNFNGKQAVFSGIAMLSVGEFSLLIAKESSSVNLGIDLVSITAAVIFLSSLAMSGLLNYTDRIYSAIVNIFPSGVKEDMNLASKYLNSISWTIFKDKATSRRIGLEWKRVVYSVTGLFLLFVIGFFVWAYYENLVELIFGNPFLLLAAVLFFALALIFPALNLFKNSHALVRDFLTFFTKLYPKEAPYERKIFANIVLIIFMFVGLIIFPSLFAIFNIKFVYNLIVLALFILILIYTSKSSRMISSITEKHKPTFNKLSNKYKKTFKQRMKMNK